MVTVPTHVLKFDKDRKFIKAFGGPGEVEGKFKTCHGIGMDSRRSKPMLLVCNRNIGRVETLGLGWQFCSSDSKGFAHACRRLFPR